MKKRRTIGPVGLLVAILVPVATIMLWASKYPNMIERRIEARKVQQRPAQVEARPAGAALEIILPDGKRLLCNQFVGIEDEPGQNYAIKRTKKPPCFGSQGGFSSHKIIP